MPICLALYRWWEKLCLFPIESWIRSFHWGVFLLNPENCAFICLPSVFEVQSHTMFCTIEVGRFKYWEDIVIAVALNLIPNIPSFNLHLTSYLTMGKFLNLFEPSFPFVLGILNLFYKKQRCWTIKMYVYYIWRETNDFR